MTFAALQIYYPLFTPLSNIFCAASIQKKNPPAGGFLVLSFILFICYPSGSVGYDTGNPVTGSLNIAPV